MGAGRLLATPWSPGQPSRGRVRGPTSRAGPEKAHDPRPASDPAAHLLAGGSGRGRRCSWQVWGQRSLSGEVGRNEGGDALPWEEARRGSEEGAAESPRTEQLDEEEAAASTRPGHGQLCPSRRPEPGHVPRAPQQTGCPEGAPGHANPTGVKPDSRASCRKPTSASGAQDCPGARAPELRAQSPRQHPRTRAGHCCGSGRMHLGPVPTGRLASSPRGTPPTRARKRDSAPGQEAPPTSFWPNPGPFQLGSSCQQAALEGVKCN